MMAGSSKKVYAGEVADDKDLDAYLDGRYLSSLVTIQVLTRHRRPG